jgi:LmbE family N-acetylglucosaminyl deacetylase
MSVPVRRDATPPRDADRPLRLPHLETGPPGAVRFLGEPLPAELFSAESLPLWEECTGERALGSWAPNERDRLLSWHRAGLIVAAPPARPHTGDAFVVSPHPDDAELALGGWLSVHGGRVVDVFTEETWTSRAYYRTRPRLAASLLIAEEQIACAVLRTDLTLLGHMDGAARPPWREAFLIPPDEAGRVTAAEPELAERVAADITAATAGTGPVLVPLAVGGHVDHILARQAVLAAVGHGLLAADRILFYEDMPYSLFADAAAAAEALAPAVERAGPGPLRPEPLVTGAGAATAKREALWAYRLQVPDGIIRRVLRHGAGPAPGALTERIWVPAAYAGLRLWENHQYSDQMR